uniref:Uncharacterized protein n=2 Tax=Gossypium raimondii TaxID=29730 RepID=A0A0D2PF15_GOSRA|nr:hypothetical protein B456_004G197100 [Gossypium raimondii]
MCNAINLILDSNNDGPISFGFCCKVYCVMCLFLDYFLISFFLVIACYTVVFSPNRTRFDFDIPIEDFMDDTCIIHSYKVFKRNGDVLNEIFENYPNIADNFRITHPDSQSYFMNSLAELYQKIKSEEEMLQQNDITIMLSMIQDEELQDITDMESKLQDFELNGLQLSGLKERLAEVRESKRLLQQINGRKAIENKAGREREEAEQQLLAKLQKKRRF